MFDAIQYHRGPRVISILLANSVGALPASAATSDEAGD
jgi:hypothetical protein